MERPILLKAHEVRGTLDGRQTQLRRIVKQLEGYDDKVSLGLNLKTMKDQWCGLHVGKKLNHFTCPFGQVGDRLWGRETWTHHDIGPWKAEIGYLADDSKRWLNIPTYSPLRGGRLSKRSSSQMPRWTSRILLEIVSVRVERLQDISDTDAMAEGCKVVRDHCHVFEGSGYDKAGLCHGTPKIAFGCRWDEIHGSGNWVDNPWVWVVEFKRVDAS